MIHTYFVDPCLGKFDTQVENTDNSPFHLQNSKNMDPCLRNLLFFTTTLKIKIRRFKSIKFQTHENMNSKGI